MNAARRNGRTMSRTVVSRTAVLSASATLLFVLTAATDTAREWRLASRPALSLGDGPTEHEEFHQVSGAVRLQSGGLAVLSAGTKDLRIFDRSGAFRRSAGRAGEGPGEFRYPAWLGSWQGDSLAVWDATLQRLTFFDASGAQGRIVTPRGLTGLFPAFAGLFSDGSFVIASGTNALALAKQPGVVRRDVVYQRFSPTGALLDTVAVVAGDELFVHNHGTRMYYTPLPFGARLLTAVHGTRFYMADSRTGVVRVLDQAGRPVTTVHVPPVQRAVSRADWQRLRQLRLARLVRDDGSVGRLFADAPMPAHYPAFDAFRVDAAGLLWVRRFTFPGEPAQWEVLAADGRAVGGLRLPPDLQVKAIGADYIVAHGRGEYDVELVRLYALSRPPATHGASR